MFSTPVRNETSNTQPARLAQNPPTRTPSGTPKTSILLKDSSNIKVGYFGKLVFLDNQVVFAKYFWDKPKSIAPNIITSQYTISKARSLYSLWEKWNLDVFLHMCGKYYVGHDSVDNSSRVKYLCCQISIIKQ